MVGLVVEDEYTINVKLRRPLGDGGCLHPPTITITPNVPAITLTPPPDTSFRDVKATKSERGGAPLVLATMARPRGAPRSKQLSIMPPSDTQGQQRECGLPLVQVYGTDDSLLATNTFLAPGTSPPDTLQPAPTVLPALTAPGTLYVPRIPEHCKSDSGVLFVPSVDNQQLRQRLQDQPPARGNSRRKDQLVPHTGFAGPPLRSAASRAAARALLSQVLSPRLALPPLEPPAPHTPRLTLNNLHLAPSHITASYCPPSHPLALTAPHAAIVPSSLQQPIRTPSPHSTHTYHAHQHHDTHYHTYYDDTSGTESDCSSEDSGERVVEAYGGGGGGGVSTAGANTSGGHHVGGGAPPQPIDPALLTSLDLEADLHPTRREMLVTDPPQQSSYPHDFNHNDHVYPHKPPDEVGQVSGRAAKYVVRTESDRLGENGHDNFAFEADLGPGQDNFGYDAGYGSERSPEDEEGPPLYYQGGQSSSEEGEEAEWRERDSRLVPGQILDTHELSKLFTFINEDTVFEVVVTKTLRGLGMAVCGGAECRDLPHAGLVRVKRLYPQTPAWLCGRLKLGDIILSANGQPLTGLTSHEALEMLRIADREVMLEVCRPPPGTLGGGGGAEGEDEGDGTGSVVSTSLTLPTRSHNFLSPSPSFSSCGEFEVVLTKVAGSLGFTLRKQDNSILGHTIRALVREPALSDGRLRPGDKIISVNATNMCSLTHQEAIAFLRTCPDTVTLKLYRDAMQTPVSPASPTEPDPTAKPKPLRKEARDMLSDLALRKQSPASSLHLSDSSNSHHASNSASASPATPRRRRLHKTPSPDIKTVVADRWDTLVRESDPTAAATTTTSTDPLTSITESDYESVRESDPQHHESRHPSVCSSSSASTPDTSRPKRPSFLDLTAGRGCPRKSQFTPPHEMDRSFPPSPQPSLSLHHNNHHPSSLPPLDQTSSTSPSHNNLTSAHSDDPPFSHLHPTYHSVNLGANHNFHNHHNNLHLDEALTLTNTTSDQNLAGMGEEGSHGLRKWKGVVFTPDEESGSSTEEERETENGKDEVDGQQEEGLWDGIIKGSQKSQKRKLVIVDLNRGWNSRLGFSLGPGGEGLDSTAVTAIYADSVAARDGRLQVGDIVVRVNEVEVAGWDSESVIDILRKTRGRISLTVLQ